MHYQYTARGLRRRRVALNRTARMFAQGDLVHRKTAAHRRELVSLCERHGYAWSLVRWEAM